MSALDKYYEYQIKNIKGYQPIQMSEFHFSHLSKKDFKIQKKKLLTIVKEYVQQYDDNEAKNLKFKTIENINYVKYLCDNKTQSFKFYINHHKIAGPDFLDVGKKLFGNKINDLPTTNINFLFKWYYTLLFLLSCIKLYFKPQCVISSNNTNIFYKFKIENVPNIKTKYALMHKMLTNLISVTPRNYFECWIPISFQSTSKNIANNMGVIPFTFKKNMSMLELQNTIESNKVLAVGSKNLLDTFTASTKFGTNKQDTLKKRVDIVISMINIIDDNNSGKITPNIVSSYFSKEMMTEYTYPIYLFSGTFYNEAHITQSVSMPDFDISQFCKNTGSIILN